MSSPPHSVLYRHRLTRLGFHFLFVALFAVVGGSLRGFNLLLVLSGLLFSVLIVQWRQGRSTMHRAAVRRRCVGGAFAGTPLSITYEIANTGRMLPVWTLRLTDRALPDPRVFESRRAEVELLDRNQEPAIATETNALEMIGSVGYVPPRSRRTTSIICRFSQRGSYQLGPLEASTTFPFSLTRSDALFPESDETLWVYPRRLTLRRGWPSLLPPRRGGDGERSTGGANQDGEFFGLRPWQSGDQPKHIHWRTTARIGEPAVRQFEQRNRHQVCLLVDPVIASDGPTSIGAFEQTLRLATTLLCELAGRTKPVSIVDPGKATGKETSPRILSATSNQLGEPLRFLAESRYVIDHAASVRPLSRSVVALASPLKRFDLVVVSSRTFDQAVCRKSNGDRGDPARDVWAYFQRRDRLTWLNVRSAEVKRWIIEDTDPAPSPDSPSRDSVEISQTGAEQHVLR